MKDTLGKLKLTFGKTFGIIAFILIFPLLLIILPFMFFQSSDFEEKYEEFLVQNNGVKFFCYTSRKDVSKLIEKEVLPAMESDIKVILLDGKTPKSDFPQPFISTMLYRIQNIGFPNIMKIVDGTVIDISLKKEFYKEVNKNVEVERIIGLIDLGFRIIDERD